MEIIDCLTSANYESKSSRKIEYIVIHYTANSNDTALGNCKYFKTENRNASAHYFVDENSVYRCVKDKDIAWHCGAKSYKHAYCRNANSIGIEMCNSTSYNEKVENKTIELVKELMSKYNIPINNILRHYDVTDKNCPAQYVSNDNLWDEFKNKINEVKQSRITDLNEAKKIIKNKCGLSDYTIQYLDMFKYSDDLILKLANNIKL